MTDSARWAADRIAICDTVTRYFTSIDHHTFENFKNVFTEDVEAIYEDDHVAGGLEKLMNFCMGKSDHPFRLDIVNLENAMHFMGNHAVELDGDVAHSETYAMAHLIDNPPSGKRMRTRGLRYVDELARQDDGRWLIRKREHILEWMRLDQVV